MISLLGQSGYPGPRGESGVSIVPHSSEQNREEFVMKHQLRRCQTWPRLPVKSEIVILHQLNKQWWGSRFPLCTYSLFWGISVVGVFALTLIKIVYTVWTLALSVFAAMKSNWKTNCVLIKKNNTPLEVVVFSGIISSQEHEWIIKIWISDFQYRNFLTSGLRLRHSSQKSSAGQKAYSP